MQQNEIEYPPNSLLMSDLKFEKKLTIAAFITSGSAVVHRTWSVGVINDTN